MKEYIKKPEVVEAVQFTSYDPDEISKILEWANRERECIHYLTSSLFGNTEKVLMLDIADGTVTVLFEDWIIKDANGYVHSCRPDIFHLLYERVSYEYPY
jgi:hypothetical protein